MCNREEEDCNGRSTCLSDATRVIRESISPTALQNMRRMRFNVTYISTVLYWCILCCLQQAVTSLEVICRVTAYYEVTAYVVILLEKIQHSTVRV